MSDNSTKVVLMAPPGTGKGRIALALASMLGFDDVLDSGRFVRRHLAHVDQSIADMSHSTIRSGGLVEDDVYLEALKEAFAKQSPGENWIMVGGPRNVKQVHLVMDFAPVSQNHVFFVFMNGLDWKHRRDRFLQTRDKIRDKDSLFDRRDVVYARHVRKVQKHVRKHINWHVRHIEVGPKVNPNEVASEILRVIEVPTQVSV